MRAITSSMLSSSSWTSSALPIRDIREPESSRPSTRPPAQLALAAGQLLVGDAVGGDLGELGAHDGEHVVELAGQAADRDADQAGVGVVAGEGEDRVGQAALLADLLEQPATRCRRRGRC